MKKLLLFLLGILLLHTQVLAGPMNTGPVSGSGSSVSDTVYGAGTWDAVVDIAPSKNAIRDKFESLAPGGVTDVPHGGTGVATLNDGGILVGAGIGPVEVIAPGLVTELLVGGGLGINPVWTAATGTGAPVRATSPTLIAPVLGTPASGDLRNTDMSVPPAIGGTTPNSATFTDLYLYGANVAHGITSIAPTTSYGAFFYTSAADGGLNLYGLSDTNATGLTITGVIGSTDPTDSLGAVFLRGSKKNGTGHQALSAAETVIDFYNYTSSIGRVYGNGEWILTSLQNTPVGSTTASSGAFTTLMSSGNNLFGDTTAVGTNGDNVIVLGVGTAPTTSATPASAAQLWVQDTGAVADNASFHMRNEYGSTGPVGFAVPPERSLASANAITLGIPDVTGKMINNYGQIALNDNITYTLPAAAANYAFTFIAGETVAKFVRFDANAADFIYLDGVVGDGAGEYIGVASVAIGNSISCRTVTTAAGNFDWFCLTIAGAWVKE